MVDALRYELAAELEKELAERFTTSLTPACAQLPTVTVVGMASVLPGAENSLTLNTEAGKLIPRIGNRAITGPSDRLGVLQEH